MQQNVTMRLERCAPMPGYYRHAGRWRGCVLGLIALALLFIVFAEPLTDARSRSMPVDRATQIYDQRGEYAPIQLPSTLLVTQRPEVSLSALHDSHGRTSDVPMHSLLEHQHLGALLLLVCLAAALLMNRAGCICRRRAPSGFLAPPLAPPKTCLAT